MSTIGGISAMGAAMPQIVSGASMRMPPPQKMNNLFQQIDTANTGNINKSQFSQAFQTLNPPQGFQQLGSDAIWAKLDANGSGSVNKQDFVSTMTALMAQLRQHHSEAAAQTAAASTNVLSTLGNNINTSA